MRSNYEHIRQDNIRRRGEEFDDIGRLIAEQLYADRSHFVYELLQNAEDALVRRFRQNPNNRSCCAVRFRLFHDRLEFRHFGLPFSEKDVTGICDVLRGTKRDDPIQIGKFGIGFKSVYAFTSSPEIHSGDEHFVIKRYIRPEMKEPSPDLAIAAGETVFVFPFDHEDLSEAQAFVLISNKLRMLGPEVMLFLRRTEEIEWQDETGQKTGQYLRDASQLPRCKFARRVTLIGQTNGHDEEEHWLVFERPVDILENDEKIPVEIAFRLETSAVDSADSIVKIDSSPLVVYFPTEKDTRLGFLMQGPYRTTSARDNVPKDDAWNRKLIEETAKLIVEALRQLKGMGLLSVAVLETLPIKAVDFPEGSMFHPIFSTVSDALIDEELLPGYDEGTFVGAHNAKLARGAGLMKILNGDQLRALFASAERIQWLSSGVTQDRTPDLRNYLIEELDVDEITPDGFARKITKSFLADRTDGWMVAFFRYLSDQTALWRKPPKYGYGSGGILRSQPILRLQDGSHVKPFRDGLTPNAYLATGTCTSTSMRIVKMELSQDEKARNFLKDLGIPDLDLVAEVIERVLPKYLKDSNIPCDENDRDLKTIERAYATDSSEKRKRLKDRLIETPFVRALCQNTETFVYRKPGQVYFRSDELCRYFDGNGSFSFVNSDYPQSDLFGELGVGAAVRVRRRRRGSRGRVDIVSEWGSHRRGLNGFDPDIQVHGLRCALSNPTIAKSTIIWNTIAVRHSDCIRGNVETSTRQTYESSEKEAILSEFGELLTGTAWVPDADGEMHQPSDLTLDDLPESFQRDERLADQLGMKKDVVAELCVEAGVSPQAIDLAQRIEHASPEDQQHIETVLQGKHRERPHFPQSGSVDPERRRQGLRRQHGDAARKEYEKRERSVRTTRGTIDPSAQLSEQYTNHAGQMVCQVCKEEMPFKKRDGAYYFEAVEALSRDYFTKEHPAQYLALCPLCAAIYKEFVKSDEEVMKTVSGVLANSSELKVPLRLGMLKISIQFVETHRHDMRTILNHRYR